MEIMKKWFLTSMALAIVFLLALGISITMKKGGVARPNVQQELEDTVQKDSKMRLTSNAFAHEKEIPRLYSCEGDDINPPLTISGVPVNSKSFVLIVDDPDAPNGNWVHWLVWNIDPGISDIKEAEAPMGAEQGMNDFKKLGWGGPCPPSGTHRYQFKLYALDTKLEIPEASNKKVVEAAIRGHILDQTTLVGLYSRR